MVDAPTARELTREILCLDSRLWRQFAAPNWAIAMQRDTEYADATTPHHVYRPGCPRRSTPPRGPR